MKLLRLCASLLLLELVQTLNIVSMSAQLLRLVVEIAHWTLLLLLLIRLWLLLLLLGSKEAFGVERGVARSLVDDASLDLAGLVGQPAFDDDFGRLGLLDARHALDDDLARRRRQRLALDLDDLGRRGVGEHAERMLGRVRPDRWRLAYHHRLRTERSLARYLPYDERRMSGRHLGLALVDDYVAGWRRWRLRGPQVAEAYVLNVFDVLRGLFDDHLRIRVQVEQETGGAWRLLVCV